MWAELAAATEAQSANQTARFLVLAAFAGLAWWVGYAARRRRHPHAMLITILGLAFFAGLVAYIATFRPVERWTIWFIAGIGFGVLLVWAHGGGSDQKSE